MPTVAIDPRGGGPGARALIAELRRFEGLRAQIWRPWSPLFPPDAVHALGGRLPTVRGCVGVATLTAATNGATLRTAALVLCPSQAAMRAAARRPGVRAETLRVVPLAPAPTDARGRRRRGDEQAPGSYALALADDPAPLCGAWELAAPAGLELRVLAAEPAERALGGARLLADLRGDVLFGGLALAALQRGIPVLAAPQGAVAEAVGDAGVVADPADDEALAQAVARALDDHEALATAGRERAGLFTWAGTAEATVMAYRELW
jgi:hypothetical protein